MHFQTTQILQLFMLVVTCLSRWDYWDSDGNPKDETRRFGRSIRAHHQSGYISSWCIPFTYTPN